MAWNNTAVTTAGNALLQRVLAGEQLSLDYAAGGSGTVDVASLMAQTALFEQKQQFNIVGISRVPNGQKINIHISNTGLVSGYTMKQLGVWAHIGYDTPVLFAILQDEKGIDIPSESDIVDFSLNFYAVIDFSGQSEFVITVDSSALVSFSVLLEELNKKADKNHFHQEYADEQHIHSWTDVDGLSDVAHSGQYSDLSEKPSSLPPVLLYDEFPATVADAVEVLKSTTEYTVNNGTKLIVGETYRVVSKVFGIDKTDTAIDAVQSVFFNAGNSSTGYIHLYYYPTGQFKIVRNKDTALPDFDMQIYRVVDSPNIDGKPKEGSSNLISSGAVYKAIEDIRTLINS